MQQVSNFTLTWVPKGKKEKGVLISCNFTFNSIFCSFRINFFAFSFSSGSNSWHKYDSDMGSWVTSVLGNRWRWYSFHDGKILIYTILLMFIVFCFLMMLFSKMNGLSKLNKPPTQFLYMLNDLKSSFTNYYRLFIRF